MTLDPLGCCAGVVIWMMSPDLPAGNGLGGTYSSASDTVLNFVRSSAAMAVVGAAAAVVVGAAVVVVVVVDATVAAGTVVFGGMAEVSDAPFVVLAHAETTNKTATRTRRRMIKPYYLPSGNSSGD